MAFRRPYDPTRVALGGHDIVCRDENQGSVLLIINIFIMSGYLVDN